MANEPVDAQSSDAEVPAVRGENTAQGGSGVVGISLGIGVVGQGGPGTGIQGTGDTAGVVGSSTTGIGVHGQCTGGNPGVRGESDTGLGVHGTSRTNHAVHGESAAGRGVVGISQTFIGVTGISTSLDGVLGISTTGIGVHGHCTGGNSGVQGDSDTGIGVLGIGHSQPGVSGTSDSNDGVRAVSNGGNGLSAFAGGNTGVGVFAQSSEKRGKGTNKIAGFFDGDVHVTGDIFLPGADCAEHFDVSTVDTVEPGTVMVINDEGALEPCREAYDRKVAGVISGAGKFRPGIILDTQDSESSRMPIALIGKVYCKVDARYGRIDMGDLLTTSPTPGHAMKAVDPLNAFGAIIGKSLCRLVSGQGLIPILIALQ